MVALCLEKQVDVVVIDNLSNSDLSNLQTLEKYFKISIPFFTIDIRDQDKLKDVFEEIICDMFFSGFDHKTILKKITYNLTIYSPNKTLANYKKSFFKKFLEKLLILINIFQISTN